VNIIIFTDSTVGILFTTDIELLPCPRTRDPFILVVYGHTHLRPRGRYLCSSVSEIICIGML